MFVTIPLLLLLTLLLGLLTLVDFTLNSLLHFLLLENFLILLFLPPSHPGAHGVEVAHSLCSDCSNIRHVRMAYSILLFCISCSINLELRKV